MKEPRQPEVVNEQLSDLTELLIMAEEHGTNGFVDCIRMKNLLREEDRLLQELRGNRMKNNDMNQYVAVDLWCETDATIGCCGYEYFLNDFGEAEPIGNHSWRAPQSDYLITKQGSVISVLCCPFCGKELKAKNETR